MSHLAQALRTSTHEPENTIPLYRPTTRIVSIPSGSRMQPGTPAGPEMGIHQVAIGGRSARVSEESLLEGPFGRLLHFATDNRTRKPRVLVVAALSGMRAPILNDMILGLLPDHDVYCLTWRDAAEIPVEYGPFDLDDNIGYLIETLRYLPSGTHVIGVCQSALPALAATAILADTSARPETLTLLGGKLDTRINPTRVDHLTRSQPSRWFENCVIATVPTFRPGHGRRVYPGSIELMMLWTYLFRQCASGGEVLSKLLCDDGGDPVGHPFLKLFLSVADVPAEFFLDTIIRVFHDDALAQGRLTWRGTRVAPEAITHTALMTVEGEADDISGLGQTRIAHDLCLAIPPSQHAHFLCPHVGHLGLIYGTVWRCEILPRIAAFIQKNDHTDAALRHYPQAGF